MRKRVDINGGPPITNKFFEKIKVNQIQDGATFQSREFWTESCFFFSTFESVWINLNLIKLDAL